MGGISVKLSTVLNSMQIRRAVPRDPAEGERGHGKVNRPGSAYPQYRVIEELPLHARTFYEEGAKLLGVTLLALVRAVFLVETELQKLASQELRREQMRSFTASEEVSEFDSESSQAR